MLTERCVLSLDNMIAHGLNLLDVCLQAANGGLPNIQAGGNTFGEPGGLDPGLARRLEWLVRESAGRWAYARHVKDGPSFT
ncbi:hypothetical protein [Singulisphaera acidiphila]|uniref:Uncharacterized protein n=1 Tax=Singulisphaera acidiphila (strain ATCC BAA-1392 / DSM 18658 / VKM B-2454 / MOB10) TaxID=886293 RepID=L0DH66_SINAD|nr:hypothetical protein [Singulisphaera acidiphila]AGA28714.1 hypothetical protein Sinac_4532 [Singulisphaera acidiphila DSM 18658]